MSTVCFIDTETTGLHPDRRVWEVAIIRRDPDAIADRELVLQVADVDLSSADPKGLQVGGFYDRHHQYAPPTRVVMGFDGGTDTDPSAFTLRPHQVMTVPVRRLCEPGDFHPPLHSEAEVARQVEQWTRGAQLIGVNPAFDAGTLGPMLRRHGLIPAWHYHLLDVSAMALGWLNGRHSVAEHGATDPRLPVAPPWKSDDLSLMCGVEPPGEGDRHTALGDADWARRWFDVMTGGES